MNRYTCSLLTPGPLLPPLLLFLWPVLVIVQSVTSPPRSLAERLVAPDTFTLQPKAGPGK